MSESPCNERRLEIFRASCTGQPRKMINLFLAPIKSLSTSERIEKTLDRLRQRYGVSGGLTTEPQIINIRRGFKVVFNVSSLNRLMKIILDSLPNNYWCALNRTSSLRHKALSDANLKDFC